MGQKILIVEDDETLLEMLVYNLERQGYEVVSVSNGRSAIPLAHEHQPDLVLLDVMLPGIDGFEVCRILRKEMNMPILMLTARSEEIDKVVGLEMGADDYLTKPFSMRELQARVKAQLRRVTLTREDMTAEQQESVDTISQSTQFSKKHIFDNLLINPTRREVRLNNQPLQLKPKEFDLILFLAEHQGIALSRSLILERVWGWSFGGNSRTVDVHVRWLRQKIETDPSKPLRIVTIRSVGYRFEG